MRPVAGSAAPDASVMTRPELGAATALLDEPQSRVTLYAPAAPHDVHEKSSVDAVVKRGDGRGVGLLELRW